MPYQQKPNPRNNLQSTNNRVYDAKKGLYTQAQLDDRFEKWLKVNRGNEAFDDSGNLKWSVADNKLRHTTFNEDWRFKIYNEGMAQAKLRHQTDSVGRQQKIDARYNNMQRNKKLNK